MSRKKYYFVAVERGVVKVPIPCQDLDIYTPVIIGITKCTSCTFNLISSGYLSFFVHTFNTACTLAVMALYCQHGRYFPGKKWKQEELIHRRSIYQNYDYSFPLTSFTFYYRVFHYWMQNTHHYYFSSINQHIMNFHAANDLLMTRKAKRNEMKQERHFTGRGK